MQSVFGLGEGFLNRIESAPELASFVERMRKNRGEIDANALS